MKILFVTYNMPIPAIAGSSQRTNLLIKALARNHKVDLFMLRGQQEVDFLINNGYSIAGYHSLKEDGAFLKNAKRLFMHSRHEYSTDKTVHASIAEVFMDGGYNLIIGRYLKTSHRAGVSLIKPSIIDIDDMDDSVILNRLKANTTPFYLRPFIYLKYRQICSIYAELVNSYTQRWVVSFQDQIRLNMDGTSIVPNTFFPQIACQDYIPSPSNSRVLWVGSFNHKVNLKGLDDFIEFQWPLIVGQLPNATLRVVGSALPEYYKKKWSRVKGVFAIGFVDNLEEEYQGACVSVVPLWDGAGTKIKVMESLSYSRTLVAAQHAVRGFDDKLKHYDALYIADEPCDLISGIVELVKDPSLRHSLERKGKKIIDQFYGFQVFCDHVDNGLDSMGKI